MLADLEKAFPVVGRTFEEASSALGLDLWKLTQEGPAEYLNKTENTQPAMLAAGVAVWRVWHESGGAAPTLLAGHSLGEYSALVCAGTLDFADAVALVAERGRLMQQAVPEGTGAMAAVLGLEDDRVREVCAQAGDGEIVEAVNFNSPGQVVIAGNVAAVERAMGLAKEAGAKRAVPLPVSVPSHCSLMKPAAERLAERLAVVSIDAPDIPVIHNVSVETAADPDRIREQLAAQLYSPVRWVETILAMKDAGAEVILEAGPGKVLAGLVKRIDKSLAGAAIHDGSTLEKAREILQ